MLITSAEFQELEDLFQEYLSAKQAFFRAQHGEAKSDAGLRMREALDRYFTRQEQIVHADDLVGVGAGGASEDFRQ